MSYCAAQSARMEHDPSNPFQRFIHHLLTIAIQDGGDKIVFGEPVRPFEIEVRETRTAEAQVPAGALTKTLEDQVAAGVMTEEEKNEIEETAAMLESLMKEVDEAELSPLMQEFRKSDPFASSPVSEIPVWCRSKGKWHQMAPLMPRLLPGILQNLLHPCFGSDGMLVTYGDLPKIRVFYTLGMEENYCYSITITRVVHDVTV